MHFEKKIVSFLIDGHYIKDIPAYTKYQIVLPPSRTYVPSTIYKYILTRRSHRKMKTYYISFTKSCLWPCNLWLGGRNFCCLMLLFCTVAERGYLIKTFKKFSVKKGHKMMRICIVHHISAIYPIKFKIEIHSASNKQCTKHLYL